MDARVVDDHGDALPPGEVGEIAITSRYLAVGYLDDEALTSAAFSPVPDRPGVRTYRTGDLGRLRSDGCLEYLGRSDGGAKVLGHRVEPAEVEAALATIAGVDAVAVKVVADASGEGHLVAWVVGTAAADQTALRAGAATLLPGHLRPTRYVPTDALPLAASGKVDRAALVEPVHATAHTAPTTDPLEPRVMEVVQRVLGHPIARHDDFFACGGDSLGAVDVVLALERVTGRRLPPSLLLAAPTVAGIATVLHERPLDPGPALMSLSIDGPGTPLVLVPSHFGNPLAYTDLARHLDGIRPVLASDVSPVDGDVIGMPFETVASRQVTAVRDTRPSGPYLLGGFCFGGAVAYDMARALIAAGDPPAGLFLLGVSPYDLPDLVPDGALERWERSETAMGKLERAARFGRGLTGSIGRRYLADRARSQARRVRELTSADGRELRRARDRRDARLRPSVGRYRGPALPIPVTLILPAWSLDAYAADPVALWAGVGSVVDVHVVPGVERMLLREPVVSEVARIMAGDPPS
jgi:thioesterase domain-containing protein/acyl carrier protein